VKDIAYDITALDAILTAEGDFAVTDNPSTQNGGIILQARGFNRSNLLLGIGLSEVHGEDITEFATQMNRWQTQVTGDGGQAAWSYDPNSGNTSWKVNYPL
jgi:hypothetical protein